MNLNNLDLNKLSVFNRIVESGSFRLAAEFLHVTPSALSQTISNLESQLGVQLFQRRGQKLVVTPQGAHIHRILRKNLLQLELELDQLSTSKQKTKGLLRVGSYFEFAKYRLLPLLSNFQRINPDIQIKLIFDTPTRLHRLLEVKKIDVCFSIYPETGNSKIESRPVYQEELVLVGQSEIFSEALSFTEIMQQPMIEYYFNHQPIRRWLYLHYRKRPRQLPIRSYGASAEIVLMMIREGLGIGVVPEYLLSKHEPKTVQYPQLQIYHPSTKRLKDHIWMLQNETSSQPEIQKSFIKAVLKGLNPIVTPD